MVMISRPDDIRTVFAGSSTQFHAGEANAILGSVMGSHSVLLLDEAEHLRVRRLLMPAFHGAALRSYQDMVGALASAEAARWPAGRSFRMHDRMQALTLEIILQVVFGVTDDERLAELRPIVQKVLDIGPLIFLGWFYPRLRPFRPWRTFIEFQQTLDRLLYDEIAGRRAAYAADALAGRDDVLSRLLRVGEDGDQGKELNDAELRDNLVTLLLAGHETTATALAWAFHELARRPEQLRRAQQAADDGDDVYLEAVAKESLRAAPDSVRGGSQADRAGRDCRLPAARRCDDHAGNRPYTSGSVPLPAARGIRSGPVLRRVSCTEHVDPVRRRNPALPRRGLLPHGGDGRPARGAQPLRRPLRPGQARGDQASQYHARPGAWCASARQRSLSGYSASGRVAATSSTRSASSTSLAVTPTCAVRRQLDINPPPAQGQIGMVV